MTTVAAGPPSNEVVDSLAHELASVPRRAVARVVDFALGVALFVMSLSTGIGPTVLKHYPPKWGQIR